MESTQGTLTLILAAALAVLLSMPAFAANVSPNEMYSATFRWEDSSELLRFTVKSEGARTWGTISAGNTVKANCEIKKVETENSLINFECRSTHFGPLAAPATLFLMRKPGEAATLRFGSWLGGYQSLPLLVEVDHFSTAAVDSKVAKRD